MGRFMEKARRISALVALAVFLLAASGCGRCCALKRGPVAGPTDYYGSGGQAHGGQRGG
jgi:hypothetical protein